MARSEGPGREGEGGGPHTPIEDVCGASPRGVGEGGKGGSPRAPIEDARGGGLVTSRHVHEREG